MAFGYASACADATKHNHTLFSYSSHTGIDLGFSNKTSNPYASITGGVDEVTETELAITP